MIDWVQSSWNSTKSTARNTIKNVCKAFSISIPSKVIEPYRLIAVVCPLSYISIELHRSSVSIACVDFVWRFVTMFELHDLCVLWPKATEPIRAIAKCIRIQIGRECRRLASIYENHARTSQWSPKSFHLMNMLHCWLCWCTRGILRWTVRWIVRKCPWIHTQLRQPPEIQTVGNGKGFLTNLTKFSVKSCLPQWTWCNLSKTT